MKRYISSVQYVKGKYKGEALETYNKMTKGEPVERNVFYINEQYGQIFYVNTQGYLHTLQKENGCVEDYVLTADNKLKWSSTYCRPSYDKEAWQQFKDMIKDAKKI